MLRGSAKRAVLLDCLLGASVLGALLSWSYYAEVMPVWVPAVMLATTAGCAMLWLVIRRTDHPHPATGIAFAVLGAAAWFLANSTLGLGMIWVSAIVLVRSLGMPAVVAYTAVIVGVGSGAHLILGSSPEQIVVEAVGGAFFAVFGGLFALLLDASERAESALRHANAELSERAGIERDLVLAEERERTARGLHDGLGHRLTAVGLSLEFAEQIRDQDPARAWEEVRVARTTALDALDDMRRLVRAMHPLDTASRAGAESFAAIADAFRASGIDIHVHADGPLADLPREQNLLLVRFVQEGLTNVIRHSAAARVDISVSADAGGAEAEIADDGGPGDSPVIEGFGLRSLRERSAALGGNLDCERTERGFRVRVRLPLADPALAGREAVTA